MKKQRKNIIYILLSLLFVAKLQAQTPKWVSTEVQNRTVVLEKFTGWKTGWYGVSGASEDRKANTMAEQHSDNFIYINIHCGRWTAEPGDYFSKKYYKWIINDYDLRTDDGDLIFDRSGEGGLPPDIKDLTLCSINRSTDPWAMSCDKWESKAIDIMNQISVVNIFVKPEVNTTTRRLTVDVEYYYTDDSPATENYLTVMLLQNEIVCPQMYADANPDYALGEDLYRHMHVLRKVISNGSSFGNTGGVWGDTITTTKKGSYECRKYIITLPDSIRNVPLDLENLEVAAFISESKSNIYTGYKAAVDAVKSELEVEDITEYSNNLKFKTIHPKVKVTGNSNWPVTKFDLEYTLANIQPIYNLYDNEYNVYDEGYITEKYDTVAVKRETYTGTLNKGESMIFELPEITQEEFNTSSIYNINSSVSNIYTNNLLSSSNSTQSVKINLIDTLFSETEITFENPDIVSTSGIIPPHTVLDNTLNPYFMLENGSCGAKNTGTAVLFLLDNFLYNVASKPGYIMFGEIDCKDNPQKILTYYYAYSDGRRNGTQPRIIVEISKDWGNTWERISDIFCKETGVEEDYEKIYVPTSEEYKQVQVNLSEYVKENFIIRIGCIPGSNGNALWIDEISIKNADNECIEENTKLSVYPNPVSNILHINNNNLLGEEYEIYDMSGKLIIKGINNTNEINIETLMTGSYSLKIKNNIFNFIKK